MTDLVRVSKRLAKVLRHDPAAAGLVLDQQGWVPVAELLVALDLTREMLDEVVAGNNKQRFAVARNDDGIELIRASQGHSVPVDLGLTAVAPPARLYHGTPVTNVDSIMAAGLRPGRRHHVHLSVDWATAEQVGRRRGRAVVLAVDCTAMAEDGHVFFRSANGVWLTDAVPPRYLSPVGRALGPSAGPA